MENNFLILFLILVFSNMVETVAGFAGTILAVTLGSYFFEIKEIIILILPITMILNFSIACRTFRFLDQKIFWKRIVFPMILGIAIGFPLQSHIQEEILKKILGVFIIFVVIQKIFTWKKELNENKKLAYLFSFLGGIIHGILTTGGPLIVLSLTSTTKDKNMIRAALSALWTLMSMVMMILFISRYGYDVEQGKYQLLLLPSIFIGIWMGEKLLHKISDQTFKKIVLVLLTVIGVSLIITS